MHLALEEETRKSYLQSIIPLGIHAIPINWLLRKLVSCTDKFYPHGKKNLLHQKSRTNHGYLHFGAGGDLLDMLVPSH